ncbi:MAG: M1 family metallopeptidase [Defluviitaleaceae bacterium]|nr:M1 family metallopeptidase [Defluviitaleaceae bacterium]
MKLRHIFIIAFVSLLAACGEVESNTEECDEVAQQISVVEVDAEENDESKESDESVTWPLYVPSYVINLEIFPDERTVNGVANVSFMNTSNYALDRVFFNLPFNAFAEDFPYTAWLPGFESRIFQHGQNFGHFNVTLATTSLNPAEFDIHGTLLTIHLEEQLPPGVAVEVGLIFDAYIPHISHRTGGNEYAMWFGNFLPTLPVFSSGHWHIYPHHPIGNPIFTTISNFEVNITAPAEYTIVSTGTAIRGEGDIRPTTSIIADHVRDFAFAVLSSSYNSQRILLDAGLEIAVYYHKCCGNEAALNALLSIAIDAFDYFENRVGIYPYQSFNIVETELFIRDSIRYPGIVFVDSRLLHTPAVHDSIVRDIGYQWFYNVVGNNPVTETWLSHGLVAFLQLGFTMDEDEIVAHAQTLHQNLDRALIFMEFPELFRDLGHYTSWMDYRNIQHSRGKLLFYALWQEMGDEAFNLFVRTYYQRYAFGTATTEGLIAIAEEIHEESLTDFFDAWINSPALPPIN